jgi:hypothetical protein
VCVRVCVCVRRACVDEVLRSTVHTHVYFKKHPRCCLVRGNYTNAAPATAWWGPAPPNPVHQQPPGSGSARCPPRRSQRVGSRGPAVPHDALRHGWECARARGARACRRLGPPVYGRLWHLWLHRGKYVAGGHTVPLWWCPRGGWGRASAAAGPRRDVGLPRACVPSRHGSHDFEGPPAPEPLVSGRFPPADRGGQ